MPLGNSPQPTTWSKPTKILPMTPTATGPVAEWSLATSYSAGNVVLQSRAGQGGASRGHSPGFEVAWFSAAVFMVFSLLPSLWEGRSLLRVGSARLPGRALPSLRLDPPSEPGGWHGKPCKSQGKKPDDLLDDRVEPQQGQGKAGWLAPPASGR